MLLDSIIVTAGAFFIPQALMAQLKKIGGRLVIPLGEDVQIMTLLIRKTKPRNMNWGISICSFIDIKIK
jgi:protein-L-isoaspartate O-methyltransferase